MLFFHSRKKQLVLQEIYAKLILFNFCEAIAGRTIVHKKGRKYAYKVNFSAAVSVCVEYLRQCKQGSPLIKLDVMITRELIPIRPGRSSPRHIKARTAASFLYR